MPYIAVGNKVFYRDKDGDFMCGGFHHVSFDDGSKRARDYAEWSNSVSELVETEKALESPAPLYRPKGRASF